MPGRLNIFQRTMLRWDEIHPYNAAHVVRLKATLDVPRLREAIRRTLAASGLGRLSLSANERAFQYDSEATEIEPTVLPPGSDSFATLVAELERQLNTPFARHERFLPFRFIALAGADGFFFGLIYFHPAADGEAAARLLRRLTQAYLGQGETAPTLELYPPRRDLWFRQSPALLAHKIGGLWRLMRNMRKSRRTHSAKPPDARNSVTYFSLAQTEIAALARVGKAWNATLNDLFLALLLKSLLRLLATQPLGARRPWLSIGCIVNLRKELGLDSPRTFGLFLGSFFITHRGAVELGLAELAQAVRVETACVKRHRLFLGAPLEMAFARWWLGFLSPAQRARFYPKHFPLWGGLTNMNLNPLWPDGGALGAGDYFRAVSTGPVTPLVFSLSSLGEATHVGVSYRTEIFSASDIEVVKNCFSESLRELARQPLVP